MTTDWINIDGGQGEGGGQVLRTALSLSLVTGRRFRIDQIRAGRQKPGLLRQHLTAVQAAVTVSGAAVSGAHLGSTSLSFTPGRVRGGDYHLAVGTAGSATLIFQTLLPALLCADGPSRVTFEGGTHNPFAPPYDFLALTFLPVLARMGIVPQVHFEAFGFYPAGGGRFSAEITPTARIGRLSLLDRGPTTVSVRALVAGISPNIGKREAGVARQRLGIERSSSLVESVTSVGPGNVLLIRVASEQVVEVVTGFGVKGVGAEHVAATASDEAAAYLSSGVPVGIHLADQLLVPLALAGGGLFRTQKPTSHTMTNAGVIQQFMNVGIAVEHEGGDAYRIEVSS